MVFFDIGHDCNCRSERMKRAIVLVGFDYEQPVAAAAQVSIPRADSSARHASGIESRRLQRFGSHHGCRGLPVGAGDRDKVATRDSFSECLCSPSDRDPKLARPLELRMIFPDRGSHDDFARVCDV